MRVLCLDIEGGYGGSSRSLYESIRHVGDKTSIEVWCRKDGPVRQRYDAIGVPCRVTPKMPHISSLPRFSRNLYTYSWFALGWPSTDAFRAELAKAASERFDVVHFNHEGLFLLLRSLRSRLGAQRAMTMHVRTHLGTNPFTRWQYRTIARNADRLAYISENERARVTALAGREVPGAVIYNIVSPTDKPVAPDRSLASDQRLKVAVLSNYAWVRGIDRVVDVAEALARCGRRDVLFVVAGNMSLPKSLPEELGSVARRGGSLEDYARQRGVSDMFRFLGHVPEPEPVLAACDVLAKPTREYNPWGRDILEAMALGKPPLSVGVYDRFIEHGVTGILTPEFDAEQWAQEIGRLADDRKTCAAMGRSAARRAANLCNGPDRARDLVALWQSALDAVNA